MLAFDPLNVWEWRITSLCLCVHPAVAENRLWATFPCKQSKEPHSFSLTQPCRAEQIQKMNYWLLDSYSISPVCLLPLWFTNLKANTNTLTSCITLHRQSRTLQLLLTPINEGAETVTVRRASLHQKSVSEVGTSDCGTLLNSSSIFMLRWG